MQRDSKWYCKQHDPVDKRKRDDERRAKDRAERDERKEKWRRDKAMRQFCDGVSTGKLERLGVCGLMNLLKAATP